MRIARYEHNGLEHVGIVRKGKLHSLPKGTDILQVLNLELPERNLVEAAAGRHHRVDIDSVRLLPPIQPRAMRDFVAFEEHVVGVSKSVSSAAGGGVPEAWYEAPAFLFMNPWSLTGPNDDLPMPPLTKALDFELEVAAIVGRTVRDVSPEDARKHIVGYTICNDWSARDIQKREMQVNLGPSKGKDFATTLGPWITSADELEPHRVGDRLDLEMTVWVNGVRVGGDRLKNMAWSFDELLSHASRGSWVGAGDVLATGTCSTGALAETWGRTGRQDPPPLAVGDIVTMTVTGLGTLSNRITGQTSLGRVVPPARRLTT